ncbi:MAG: hypothetical protein M3446_09390 [Actinomycetota bacterium]|nr:hypothetical protein [Actinomycetota bacterium]
MSTSTISMTSPVDAGPDVLPGVVVTNRSTSGSLGAAHSLGIDPERLLLDAAALRRRQLCAAFLHGSARSWRIRRRIWPAAIAGLLIVAVTIAALAVAAAFTAQQQLDRERQSRSIGWDSSGAPALSGR